ncbi:L,D-transpeptidase family protein [Agrobacterium tumefaciens]|uniref:L,D-transpeptidase family protein n=1 Tax=Agrobacterium tumefaciens TaxID=358 RepID=UPI0015741BFE|nr:murein L,D-transpeptidase family protein [Agrobacterium tumefaciens]MBU1312820.1 murein L,D-transpeptidase [Alphaproteobacteria bacterium]MBU1551998.1 murein L,D-transpeptidase [Alphaproteobacteria bacterium]MBU2337545.1 murein L,D-transpeptidase [Alphaproteobacteria bacterium]MBU2388186.1 murein L,D-transpeptidase [Alphaproteobacteria bacterium]WCK16977.1 murein L,D-transpeptidase [Agrobacterium tumefaciens]
MFHYIRIPIRGSLLAVVRRIVAMALLGAALSGCVAADLALDDISKSAPEISGKMLAEMSKKGMRAESPVLVRIFKQESELEVWKLDLTGKYALLKTYPMCRWSGKLGPKTRNGDRQAPEGFYHVSAGMLNPKSQYYVSFNLGYPNRLESALGYTGEALMVHGACSSSGCYALTDQGVGEIYAIVSKALASGQDRFQVQAYPFRMTLENMALHKGDANLPFWKTLKEGYDAFELTKQQPKVSVCGRRYVFNTEFEGGEPRDPLAACPATATPSDRQLVAKIGAEKQKMEAALAESNAFNVTAYVDGGMHSSFRALLKKDGPEKLAERISGIKYPVSRPDAALADPFKGISKRSGAGTVSEQPSGD